MAVIQGKETAGPFGAKSHEFHLDLGQAADQIVTDVYELLGRRVDPRKILQYLHPMGDWRVTRFEDARGLIHDHIATAHQRHHSVFESLRIHDANVTFSEGGIQLRRPQTQWEMAFSFTETHDLGDGTVQFDEQNRTWRPNQQKGRYVTPHALRFRQLA